MTKINPNIENKSSTCKQMSGESIDSFIIVHLSAKKSLEQECLIILDYCELIY